MLFEQCETKVLKLGNIADSDTLKENLAANCIPEGVISMDVSYYEQFLLERRRLMARKINDLTDNMDIRRFRDIGPNDIGRLRKYLKAYNILSNN